MVSCLLVLVLFSSVLVCLFCGPTVLLCVFSIDSLCFCMFVSILLFSSFMLGSVGSCCLDSFLCCISSSMCFGNSLCLFLIFPRGILCLSEASMMFISVLFAVCTFFGGEILSSASSISCVYTSQLAFL